MRASYRQKGKAGLCGLLLLLFLASMAVGEVTGSVAGPFLAVEMLQWAPEKIEEALRAETPAYAGESPEELLKILDFMVQQEEGLTGRRGSGVDSLGQGYGPSIDLVLDLLHEWPSPRQVAAVNERLQDSSGKYLHSALRAAASSATNPVVAAAVADALGRTVKNGQEACVVLALLALGESRNPGMIPTLEPFLKDPNPARRDAASRALRALRLTGVLPLDNKAEVPAACVIGPDWTITVLEMSVRYGNTLQK